MLEIFRMLNKYEITPNGFYLMLSMKEGVTAPGINTNLELRGISRWIDLDTQKLNLAALQVISEVEAIVKVNKKKVVVDSLGTEAGANIDTYINFFPKGKLPSGKPARTNKKELEANFRWFFQTYEYSWDVVLRASAYYVDEFEKASPPYMYMKTAGYFISKMKPDRTRDSELANYCQIIVDGADEPKDSHLSDKIV